MKMKNEKKRIYVRPSHKIELFEQSVSKTAKIYSDGGCSPNPGLGTWAAIVEFGDASPLFVFGKEKDRTTNNRMEMMGVLVGLQSLENNSNVEIVSDSTLVVGTLNCKYRKKSNIDLWMLIDAELRRLNSVNSTWVKGKNDCVQNIFCDVVCQLLRSVDKEEIKEKTNNKSALKIWIEKKSHLLEKVEQWQLIKLFDWLS